MWTPPRPLPPHRLRGQDLGRRAFALSHGDIRPERETLVRVHEPISVLDFLDAGSDGSIPSRSNRRSPPLAAAEAGVIVLLYRPMSGRGCSPARRPPTAPTAKWDARLFGVGAQILRALRVGKMRLLASPRKIPSMTGFGLEITGFVDKN